MNDPILIIKKILGRKKKNWFCNERYLSCYKFLYYSLLFLHIKRCIVNCNDAKMQSKVQHPSACNHVWQIGHPREKCILAYIVTCGKVQVRMVPHWVTRVWFLCNSLRLRDSFSLFHHYAFDFWVRCSTQTKTKCKVIWSHHQYHTAYFIHSFFWFCLMHQ